MYICVQLKPHDKLYIQTSFQNPQYYKFTLKNLSVSTHSSFLVPIGETLLKIYFLFSLILQSQFWQMFPLNFFIRKLRSANSNRRALLRILSNEKNLKVKRFRFWGFTAALKLWSCERSYRNRAKIISAVRGRPVILRNFSYRNLDGALGLFFVWTKLK